MRLSITHTKNNTYFYMIKSYRDNGKNKTKIVECLGNINEVIQKANGENPIEWAKKYIAQKTLEEKEGHATYFEKLVEGTPLNSDQKVFNLGYLFLSKLYHQLKLDEICKNISKQYKFEYDLNAAEGLVVFHEISRTFVFLKPNKIITITIRSTDGSNKSTQIQVMGRSPK